MNSQPSSTAAPQDPQQTVTDLFMDSIQQTAIKPITFEGKDGIVMGGMLIVRGEREFELLCAFIRNHSRP